MDIKLFSFSKKTNSTKRPVLATGRNFACTLNENTSMLSPVIKIKAPLDLDGITEQTYPAASLPSDHLSISNGAQDKPFTAMTISMDPIQEGTGDPSPSNPRPITGRTAIEVGNANDNTHNVTIQLGRTVYGGTLDVVSGVLTVTHEVVDLGDIGWNATNSDNVASSTAINSLVKRPSSNDTVVNAYCDSFKMVSRNQFVQYQSDYQIAINISGTVMVHSSDLAGNTSTQNKTALTDIKLVYPLATPTTYQLTPADILLVQNNNYIVLSDSGLQFQAPVKYMGLQAGLGRMYDFNYAYIPDLKRYYWISDIKYTLGTWEIDLDIDVLASWKTYIGSSREYILRSSYTKDENVIDSMYPTKSRLTTQVQTAGFSIYGGNGLSLSPCYLLSVVGPNHVADAVDHRPSMLASTTYYVLSGSDLELLCYAMMDNIEDYQIDVGEISYALQKQLINPYQYLVDLKLLPWTPDQVRAEGTGNPPVTVTDIPLGFNELSMSSGWAMARQPLVGLTRADSAGLVKHFSNTLTIYKNPKMATMGNWVNHSPFSEYIIYVEPFGRIQIPDSVIMQSGPASPGNVNTFDVVFDATCDAVTGTVRLELSTYYSPGPGETAIKNPFFVGTSKVGCSIPLWRTQQNIIGAAESIGSAAGSVMSAAINPIGAAVSSAGHLMDAFDKMTPDLAGGGSFGSMMDCFADLATPRVVKRFAEFVEFNNDDNGSPLCQIKQLSTIPGFILCEDAHFAAPASEKEIGDVVNFMNSGFFYE